MNTQIQNVYTTSAESNPSPEGLGLGESLGSTISETPETTAMIVANGIRCKCAELPILLCQKLESENIALHRWQNGLEAEIKELRFKAEENARLLTGCEQAEKLVNAGAYTKWQDGAWWIFWESNGEVAAGPAKSLYELALILSNIGIDKTDTTGNHATT
ncbi:MAG: hypothetical protein ACOYM3_20605 [Terrimicrobiaceae bacterium]